MKKLLLIIGVIISCIIYSCRKDLPFVGKEVVSDRVIAEAKQWHKIRTSGLEASGDKNGKKAKVLDPIWADAHYETLGTGKKVIVIPAKDFPLRSKKVDYVRKFIFIEEGGKITGAHIVEIYGDNEYVDRNRDNLITKYGDEQISDFDGAIMIYDVNYNLTGSKVYKEGRKVPGSAIVKGAQHVSAMNSKRLGTTTVKDETFCIDWYWVSTWNGQETWTYLYTDCYGGSGGGPGGNSGGCSANCGVSDFIKDLGNSCLSATFDQVNSNSLSNRISYMLNSVFNKSTTLVLNWQDVTSLPDTVAGYFDPGATSTSGEYTKLYIELNENTLPSASREYQAAVMMHEAVHAYLSLTNDTNLLDHATMGVSYRGQIAGALQEIFGMSQANANALSWVGLTVSHNNSWQILQNADPTQAASIASILASHRSPGTSGTRCN